MWIKIFDFLIRKEIQLNISAIFLIFLYYHLVVFTRLIKLE